MRTAQLEVWVAREEGRASRERRVRGRRGRRIVGVEEGEVCGMWVGGEASVAGRLRELRNYPIVVRLLVY